MIDMNLNFSGLENIAKDLDALSRAESNRVLRNATRAGAAVIRQEVIATASEDSGKMKRNVVILTQKSRRGEISSGVHIRGVNPDTGGSDTRMAADDPKNAYYWRFVELGTSKMPAIPFVRPAYDAKEESAAQAVIDRANQAIDEALSK